MANKNKTNTKKTKTNTNKTLVIVESPAKAKTIKKYLPRGYNVEASMGHVRDLPKSKLGIDIEHNFEPSYITIRGKGEVLQKIKRLAKSSKNILLATDPDREGEAISWHIANYLKLNIDEVNRIEFNEITKEAIKNAISNKRKINMDLVDAQQARRILDRLVGYSISPLLWKKVRKGLSAGRVQSVATRIIVDREKEIMDFVSEEYWLLYLDILKQGNKNTFEAKFYGSDNKKQELKNIEQVEEIIKNLSDPITVKSVIEGKRSRRPPLPFTTSTLQQDAFKKLNFSTRKTMSIAQQLYEGLNIEGHGHIGLITYMRTDSTRVSDEAKENCKAFIINKYGKDSIGDNKRAKSKGKNVQDAHEAIRPTTMELDPMSIKDSLKREQYRLYKLIWDRFVASQMANALYDTVSADLESGPYIFRSAGSRLVFKGYLAAYGFDKKSESEKNEIPKLEKGETLSIKDIRKEQKFTSPPPRFTEASLVKILEEKGIGRPSTYSPTIQTILTRRYVEVEDKKFYPTELGFMVNDLMEGYFEDIVDVSFTAEMEGALDKVADGEEVWQNLIANFYEGFSRDLKVAEEEMEEIKIEDPVSDEKCEKCGKYMVIKTGRYGKFLACPGFPDCRNAKAYLEEIGVKCPKCEEGDLVVRKTKKGRTFYGCKTYPDCDYTSWDKPIPEKCPKCKGMLLQKGYGNRKKIYCSDEECGYKES